MTGKREKLSIGSLSKGTVALKNEVANLVHFLEILGYRGDLGHGFRASGHSSTY